MKESRLLNIDETGWKNNGELKWLWKFTNKDVSINQILHGRGQKDLESILGKKYDGIIISGFLSAYNKIEAKAKQRCLVHLTFLDYPGIDYHNNHAERQIRPNVLLRKIVFGNRSDKGILNHNCLMGIIQTAHLKKQDPFKVLQKLLFTYDKPNAAASVIPP